ncbi:MAG: hypothetical protein IJ333_05230 [Clostridia bacterium]|nr:hypothetical protein [Clostridia bacterium]
MKKQISICVDPEVLERLKQLAKQEERSLSRYINRILKQHTEKHQTKANSILPANQRPSKTNEDHRFRRSYSNSKAPV